MQGLTIVTFFLRKLNSNSTTNTSTWEFYRRESLSFALTWMLMFCGKRHHVSYLYESRVSNSVVVVDDAAHTIQQQCWHWSLNDETWHWDGFENISAEDTNNYGFKVPSMFINYFFWIEKQHTLAKKPQKKKNKIFLFIYLSKTVSLSQKRKN